jgi:hypothetical protein
MAGGSAVRIVFFWEKRFAAICIEKPLGCRYFCEGLSMKRIFVVNLTGVNFVEFKKR